MGFYHNGKYLKDAQKSWRASASRDLGKAWETMIEGANEIYRYCGAADIRKTPEPMRPLKDIGGGKFVACFEKKSEPDFKGVLRGGRCVCFEAKATDDDKMLQSRVTEAQTEILERYNALGAICFVAVSFGLQDNFLVPWRVWRSMKDIFGRKYIKRDEIEVYRIKTRNGGIDYLSQVARMMGEKKDERTNQTDKV